MGFTEIAFLFCRYEYFVVVSKVLILVLLANADERGHAFPGGILLIVVGVFFIRFGHVKLAVYGLVLVR
jgi:hypothetical protein